MELGHKVSKNWTPLPRYILRKYNVLNQIKKLDEGSTFIDFGCGAGDLACSAAKLGLKGTGYDFSDDAISVANSIKKREKLNDNQIKFEKSKTEIKEINKTADIVLCMEVLEHIKNDKEAFRALVEITNKYLLISVPAKQKLFGYSDTLAGHYRRYNRDDLLELIKHEGLEVINIIGYGYPFTNISRIFLEKGAKRNMHGKEKEGKEELSKDSGINIFKIPKFLKSLDLEMILKPFYWFSKLFNKFDVAEGYLVVLRKNEFRELI